MEHISLRPGATECPNVPDDQPFITFCWPHNCPHPKRWILLGPCEAYMCEAYGTTAQQALDKILEDIAEIYPVWASFSSFPGLQLLT